MKVLITWADHQSTNLGVRALADGAAALADLAWPGVEVDFVGYGASPAPMRVARPRALLREAVTRKHGLRAWLRGYDVVLDTRAGDSFADIYGLPRLRSMTALAEFARWSGVPVVMAPQTIGPFATRQGRLLASRSMQNASLVMVRDSQSLEPARELGPADRIVSTTDVVFALPPAERGRRRDVVINVSGLLWSENSHVDAERYRRDLIALVVALRTAGREISVMAHVLDSPLPDNDVPAVRALAEEIEGSAEVIVPTSLAEVRSVVTGAELVIGSRMHACLNALSVGTPAIALAYSRKFAPLLEDLGWTWTVDLRTADDVVTDVMALLDGPPAIDPGTVRRRARERIEAAALALRGVV